MFLLHSTTFIREIQQCRPLLLLLPPPPPSRTRRNTEPTPSSHGTHTSKSCRLIFIPSKTTMPIAKIWRKNAPKTLWFSAMKLRALRDGIGRLVGPPKIAQIRMATSISELGRNIHMERRHFMMTLREMEWNGMEYGMEWNIFE